MPFDAGVMSAVAKEICKTATNARIDKIYQPGRDEIVLNIRTKDASRKILLSCTSGISRVSFSDSDRENPALPPMFCMLLRKHLSGGHILEVRQLGFDRALEIKIVSSDEMGFSSEKYLICEIMGTYSNVVLLDKDKKVISALHTVPLSVNNKRQVLCGFKYEDIPLQEGKINALEVTKEMFLQKLENDIKSGKNGAGDKYLISCFSGLSPLIAREIVFRSSKETGTPISEIDCEKLWFNFNAIYENVKKGIFSPCLVRDKNGKVLDFSFCEIRQYGMSAFCENFDSISALLDVFYEQKDRQERIKHKGQDILRLLTNAQTRINKKTALQREDLSECAKMDEYKNVGDLITANMYLLKKGMKEARLIDYTKEDMPEILIKLDERYTPSQNAQIYYKKYNKAKTAKVVLSKQIKESEKELLYIESVFESLVKAETEADLQEIRNELYDGGYGKKLDNMRRNKASLKKDNKKTTLKPKRFKTSSGFEVVVGKNNLQNDYVTFHIAEKNDLWFHVKDAPGSHVVMKCGETEPSEKDYTECANLAAYFSSQKEKPKACVDYTRVRNVKKPSGSKPGFVIYETNYTAYVTADEALVKSLETK